MICTQIYNFDLSLIVLAISLASNPVFFFIFILNINLHNMLTKLLSSQTFLHLRSKLLRFQRIFQHHSQLLYFPHDHLLDVLRLCLSCKIDFTIFVPYMFSCNVYKYQNCMKKLIKQYILQILYC